MIHTSLNEFSRLSVFKMTVIQVIMFPHLGYLPFWPFFTCRQFLVRSMKTENGRMGIKWKISIRGLRKFVGAPTNAVSWQLFLSRKLDLWWLKSREIRVKCQWKIDHYNLRTWRKILESTKYEYHFSWNTSWLPPLSVLFFKMRGVFLLTLRRNSFYK